MQLENNTKLRLPKWKLPKMPRGSGFYLALSLAVAAAGVGTWGAVSHSLRSNPYQPQQTSQRSTINWENYVTRPATQPANDPVTNVPEQRTEPPATTAAAAKPDNAPYTGTFALPFGTNIAKDYSDGAMVRSETMGDWRVHNGVDFAGELDQPVVAIQAGTVRSVKADPLWGLIVTIDHGQGVVARYCGLSENSVPQEGFAVKMGEQIGVIAQIPCESAEGLHLHLEITVDGKTADPLAVMHKG